MGTKQLNIVSDGLKLFASVSALIAFLCLVSWNAFAVPKVKTIIKEDTKTLRELVNNINYKATKSLLLQEMYATPEQREHVERQLRNLNLKPGN